MAVLPVGIGSEEGGYKIENSLRFNAADNAYLSRTPASAGNRKTWTWSGWVKLSDFTHEKNLFTVWDAANDNSSFGFQFLGTGTFRIGVWTYFALATNAYYRDPSGWYHVVVVLDTTQATASNRLKLYINGEEVTSFSIDNRASISQNQDMGINLASQHMVGGSDYWQTSTYAMDGYMAEVHFVDGQALTPSSFGEFNGDTGAWQPKAYSGSYGTNGFYLPFSENDAFFSSATGGKFTTTSVNSIYRTTGNDSAGVLSGLIISGDFDIYWKYGTASGGLSPGDAYVVGVIDASYKDSFNYNSGLLGGNSSTVFYTQYGGPGFYTAAYVNGSQTDSLTSGTNPSTTSYVRISRSGSTISIHQGVTPGSWTLIKTFTGTSSADMMWFFGSGNKDQNISLNNITFNSINGVSTTNLINLSGVGSDNSGNGNNFFPQNISSIEGVGNDSLVDSPASYGTDTGAGGEVRGNYCTLSPINRSTSSPAAVLVEGNLRLNCPTGANSTPGSTAFALGTMLLSSGKWYFESKSVQVNGSAGAAGIGVTNAISTFNFNGGNYSTSSFSNLFKQSGPANTVMIAYDADNNLFWKGQNGTWDAGNPAAGTGGTSYTGPVAPFAVAYNDTANRLDVYVNFGQRPFTYTAPSGFKALCTTNLPESNVLDGGEYFNPVLYTGNGSTLAVTGVGFAPDLVWSKGRSAAKTPGIYDTVRGATKKLAPSLEAEEITQSGVSAFGTDGFTLGSDDGLNGSGTTYVAWCWKEAATAGLDIISYTGTGSARTIAHNLGTVPAMMIVKRRSSGGSGWITYHKDMNASPATGRILLNETGPFASNSGLWNNTAPTSSVFTLGGDSATNGNGSTYIAYLFAPVDGFSAFGKYTGNGSSDGPFVYTGFRPKYLAYKMVTGSQSWGCNDAVRDPENYSDLRILLNAADSEEVRGSTDCVDFLANGFKIRATSTIWNGSGSTYIYMAFAENPFKYALAR